MITIDASVYVAHENRVATTRLLTKPIAGSKHDSMDKLDQLIADKIAEIDGLAQKRQYALIELEALKRAAQARPAANGAGVSEPKASPSIARVKVARSARSSGKSRGGRQAGDISREWRKVLAVIHRIGGNHSYPQFQRIADGVGIKSQLPNVRERVRVMAENGLLKGSPENGFHVTNSAVARFKLDEIAKQMEADASRNNWRYYTCRTQIGGSK